jgi:Leucine-rich repeat (LRR) protein
LARAGTLLARLGHLLQSLNLSRTKVTDLEPLKGLTALQFNLSLTKFTDLGPLKELGALQSLYLSGTNLTDIEPLKGLTALELLDLSGTNVTDLGPVYDLPHLRIKANDSPPVQHFRNYRRERKFPY